MSEKGEEMQKILEVRNLKKTFHKNKVSVKAVEGIQIFMDKGECLGLVGESGCGKSTTAKLIAHLAKPDEGSILLNGEETVHLKGRALKDFYSRVQMVFQTPQDSFDPRCTLGDGIMEGMRNHGMSRARARGRMLELLDMVELDSGYAVRFPHEVSGGECQRAAIARALAVEPELLICDEVTSALDVTVQAQIIGLLKRLQKERGLSLLLICHDLALVQYMCDRVAVMHRGLIVEEGIPDDVICHPKAEYTKLLVDSAF